jgi:predicted porin
MKKNISFAILGLLTAQLALADKEFKSGPCTFKLGGQLQTELSRVSGGLVAGVNEAENKTQYYFDLKTGYGCDISKDFGIETMLRTRPLKGNTFDIQGNGIGSREAWFGLKSSGLGTVRYGRFLNRMVDEVDEFGAPNLYAEASTYNATGGDMTRSPSLRYATPVLAGFQGEVTVGGKTSQNRDLELYGKFNTGSWEFQSIFTRSVMNGAYAALATPTFGDRELVNSGLFGGAGYSFANGAKIKAGVKLNKFALPSNANTGVYTPGGSVKSVTDLNTLMLNAEYPLGAKFTLSGGLLRFMDTKTRGVTANDGATLANISLKYAITSDAAVFIGFKQTKLDRAGAIPGSGAGVNAAMPDATTVGNGISDKRWVFNQSFANNSFNSPSINTALIKLEYNF